MVMVMVRIMASFRLRDLAMVRISFRVGFSVKVIGL